MLKTQPLVFQIMKSIFKQVEYALDLAHLTELTKSLEQGIHTKVGERGIQLSGGQRQRIGITKSFIS